MPKFDVLLTTYETLISDTDELAELRWRYVVVDEGHRLKNRASRILDSLQQCNAERRLLLTGTPIQNSTAELFTLLNFVVRCFVRVLYWCCESSTMRALVCIII